MRQTGEEGNAVDAVKDVGSRIRVLATSVAIHLGEVQPQIEHKLDEGHGSGDIRTWRHLVMFCANVKQCKQLR